MTHHYACFFPRNDKLLVTFDHFGSVHSRPPRLPWGHDLAQGMGWSHLGTMTKRNDWFRHRDMFTLFRELRSKGFFADFEEVVFYGASMGGYAAAAFSVVHPGARVVLMAPQSTLKKTLVPWEKRFKIGRELGDWSGPWVDAARTVERASAVSLFYDPYHPGDAAHAARLQAPAITPFRSPFLGHQIPQQLLEFGLAKEVAVGAITGSLTPPVYSRMIRARKHSTKHVEKMLHRAINAGHLRLADSLLSGILDTRSDRKFTKLRKPLRAALRDQSPFDWSMT